MTILELFNSLKTSLQQKQNIINGGNSGGYNCKVKVPYEHKMKVSIGGWFKTNWVWKTETRYRDEIGFDYEKYNKDILNTNQAISKYQEAINNYIKSSVDQYSNLVNKNQGTKEQIVKLGNDITYYRDKLGHYNDYNNRLNSKVAVQPIQEVSYKINHTLQEESDIQNSITTIDALDKRLEGPQERHKLIEMLAERSETDRAKLMFHFWGKEKFVEIISIIESIGYSANYLAYLAISNNNIEIFKYALKLGAKCDVCRVENQTLLERILTTDLMEWVNLVRQNNSLETFCTMINAARNGNLKAIKKLYELDHNIFKKHDELSIYTPLQLLLMIGELDVIKCVVDMDKGCLDVLSKRGDSTFALALRCCSNEVIKMLAELVNIKTELYSLVDKDQGILIKKALTECKIDQKVCNELLEYSLVNGKIGIAKTIADSGANLVELFNIAVAKDDFMLLDGIRKVSPKFWDENGLKYLNDSNVSVHLKGLIQNAHEFDQHNTAGSSINLGGDINTD